MSALETFRFNGYTLRPAGAAIWDFRVAVQWTEADAVHRGLIAPAFWVTQGRREDAFLLADNSGPILFFKMVGDGPDETRSDTVQAFIQFSPAPAEPVERRAHSRRTREAMTAAFEWVEQVLKLNGVREINFDSCSRMLVRFSVEKLGFKREASNAGGWRLKKVLEPIAPRGV